MPIANDDDNQKIVEEKEMSSSKKKLKNLRPWEKEAGRKRQGKIGPSIPEKTGIKSRVHSKPQVRGQEYLDMYMLLKEKERLENYGETLTKRSEQVVNDWVNLKVKILKDEKDLPKVAEGGMDKDAKKENKSRKQQYKKMKNMKTLDWNY
ncbi:MAG: hypothetical protein H8E32_13975 [Nitrospinae bacterium]|nr:hypothetical protein [Nitrospinota bacterium]